MILGEGGRVCVCVCVVTIQQMETPYSHSGAKITFLITERRAEGCAVVSLQPLRTRHRLVSGVPSQTLSRQMKESGAPLVDGSPRR